MYAVYEKNEWGLASYAYIFQVDGESWIATDKEKLSPIVLRYPDKHLIIDVYYGPLKITVAG